ncbi:hypothetical protein [Sphingomonas sp. CROZ-RG-20F-R02-07]|uniref:hypothetical protein n=1 Tax=Sphingomonas sp. CROZ-RG-20F-R02-07 TaxID=2914832 RepID=UPI001F5982C2|nr:hypothetical protein [Sphingomonas sp. CROZ-RG-20F-R02-07]
MIAAALLLAGTARFDCVVAGPGGHVAADLLAARLDERRGRPIPRGRCRRMLLVARTAKVAAALPRALRARWRDAAPVSRSAEGYAVRRLGSVTVIAAQGTRGLVYGAGWALRAWRGLGTLAMGARVDAAPAYPARLTQIGYRAKNNSYDAWTLAMFRRRIEDLALWGASGVQVIAPVSDDAVRSPLFPAPPVPTLAGIGRIAHRLGIDFALYYPLLGDYAARGAIAAETARLRTLLAALPRVDALYIPGGDPGHSAPPLLFRVARNASAVARRANPAMRLWLSTQGFDAAGYDGVYAALAKRPRWLTGVFVGPQSRDPLPLQRRRIPARYPLQLYPDIAHTMHAQFPVDRWHPAFALSEGREPIDPRPIAFAAIFRRLAPLSRGFVTYSEGVNDDANQYLWMRLGWTPGADPAALMADYGRVVMGDARAGALAMALERDWVGDPAQNAAIDRTRALADALRGTGWQADSLGYRATYDALVRVRLIAARARDAAATAALARGDADAAIAAYATTDGDAAQVLRTRLFALAARLYAQARLQLSVPLYGASGTERGANLDRADVPLDDRAWLAPRIAAARGDPAALADLADHARAREGALYDDLGDPDHEPHLVRGTGLAADPQGFATAIDGIADRTPADGWRLSEISYAETLYDAPLRLHYTGLDPARGYRLVAAWAGEDYALPMRLVANGSVALHPFRARRANPETVEVAIPHALTAGGTLDLAWSLPPGLGGSGRGHQIAETWLIPEGTTP